MLKVVYFLISRLLFLINIFFKKIFNNHQFFPLVHEYIESKQYYSKKICDKTYNFFYPNRQTLRRVETLFTKEPETLNWIDSFQSYNYKNIVFWDIGANIGLYSIYAAAKLNDIEIISFEPSTSNTRTLSRNVSINNFEGKINIFPLALTDKENIISSFNEISFSEGGSNSQFDTNFDNHGKLLTQEKIKNKYNLFGTSIDNLILNNVLKIPNYIKIDVDGIEHLILKGAKNLLKNENLREFSIEMNPTNTNQYKFICELLEKNNFELISSTNSRLYNNNYKLRINENVNVIFKRIN